MTDLHRVLNPGDWADYCAQCNLFRSYDQANWFYPLLGLSGEVGEFAQKRKREIRDGTLFVHSDAISELGDILWYLAIISIDSKCINIDMKVNFEHSLLQETLIRDSIEFGNREGLSFEHDNIICSMVDACNRVHKARRLMVLSGYAHDSGVLYSVPKAVASVAITASLFEMPPAELSHVMTNNIEKLNDRKSRNVLHGSGDNR